MKVNHFQPTALKRMTKKKKKLLKSSHSNPPQPHPVMCWAATKLGGFPQLKCISSALYLLSSFLHVHCSTQDEYLKNNSQNQACNLNISNRSTILITVSYFLEISIWRSTWHPLLPQRNEWRLISTICGQVRCKSKQGTVAPATGWKNKTHHRNHQTTRTHLQLTRTPSRYQCRKRKNHRGLREQRKQPTRRGHNPG